MKTQRLQQKENPVLLDSIVQDLQKVLTENLVWLNHAFGKAYKLVDNRPDGNKYIYPAAYCGESEYVSLLPNDTLGNFSWIDIYDPQKITVLTPRLPQCSFNGALIFWYNTNSIYEDKTMLYTEEIKNEILKVLTTPGIIIKGKFIINDVYERFENIYKGYSVERLYENGASKSEDLQFFMHPYAGIRIEFTIKTKELCVR